MNNESLVRMANDIGAFFAAEPDRAEAARLVAAHIKRFWDPRMRKQLLAYYREGGGELDPLVHTAVGQLADTETAL